MWLSSPLSLGSLALASSVSAVRHALVHTPFPSDTPQVASTSSVTLSPSEARLILAQRLGVAQYHSLKDADQYTLEAINNFGVASRPLSGSSRQSHSGGLLIVVEGIDDPENFLGSSSSPNFKIDNPPSLEATSHFLQDLSAQQNHSTSNKGSGYYHDQHCELKDVKACVDSWTGAGRIPPIYHSKHLPELAKSSGGPLSTLYRSKVAALKQSLTNLIRAQPQSVDLTILLMPLDPPPTPFLNLFPSTQPTWGPAHNPLARRQSYSDEADQTSTTTATATQTSSTSSSTSTTSKTSTTSSSSKPTNTTPPKGILQVCYTSQDACEKYTHSCSGHGECKKIYTMPDTDDAEKSCYACECKATTKEDDNGNTKTTLWAGPACQKKDISSSFWLLAGATIGLVSAVAWGIGILVEMGGEELPGVLSAGVVGIGGRGK